MRCKHVLSALLGSMSLVSAAPASLDQDVTPAERGLRHKPRRQLGTLIQPDIQISNTQITVINQNLGVISQLAQLAEQQLAALVQAQIQLVTQLETIKNNIRINHFKARFSQVNTVIVTVTNIVDARDTTRVNRRYLMDQLRIDNGVPDKELVVMVTQKDEMTISAAATPTLSLANFVASASAGLPTPVSNVVSFDPAAPFALFNSSSLILPYNTSAPTNPLVFEDPANIIFAGQHNLLVESIGSLQADCVQLAATNSLINQAALQLALFGSFQQAAAAQIAGLHIGGGIPVIPTNILVSHPDLAEQYTHEVDGLSAIETSGPTATAEATVMGTEAETAASSTTEAEAAQETNHGDQRRKGGKGHMADQ